MKKTSNNIIILLFSLLFHATSLQAQQASFEFLLSTDDDEVVYNIMEDAFENCFYLTGSSNPASMYHTRGLLIKLSNEGLLIDSTTISDPDQSIFMHDILPGYRDSVVIGMAKYDTGWSNQTHRNVSVGYHICDKSFNSINTILHPLSDQYYYFQSYNRRLENNKIIVLGSLVDTIYTTSRPNFFLYELTDTFDSSRLIIWHDSLGSGQDIRLMENGNYWSLINGFDTYRPYYYELDTAYNFLSKEKTPNNITDPFGIKWVNDSVFYIAGEWNGGPDDDIGFMRQLRTDLEDPDENMFNSFGTLDTLDMTAVKGGLDFSTTDSIYIGGMALWWGNFLPVSNYFFVVQTDSLLNIRWERFYGGDAYYVMFKLIKTSDGGCIVAGSKYDYLNTNKLQRDIYVLKLDKEGLFVGKPESPTINMQEAIVFPNPGSNQIKVRVAAQYPNSTFELYDMAGNKILIESIIGKWGEVNTSFLPIGNYVYRIFNDDGLFETGKWVKQ